MAAVVWKFNYVPNVLLQCLTSPGPYNYLPLRVLRCKSWVATVNTTEFYFQIWIPAPRGAAIFSE